MVILSLAENKKPCKSEIYRVLEWFDNRFCGISWDRTSDTRIFSPLLYRLSYDTSFCGSANVAYFL